MLQASRIKAQCMDKDPWLTFFHSDTSQLRTTQPTSCHSTQNQDNRLSSTTAWKLLSALAVLDSHAGRLAAAPSEHRQEGEDERAPHQPNAQTCKGMHICRRQAWDLSMSSRHRWSPTSSMHFKQENFACNGTSIQQRIQSTAWSGTHPASAVAAGWPGPWRSPTCAAAARSA